MQWRDYTTLPSRGLRLRPTGKSRLPNDRWGQKRFSVMNSRRFRLRQDFTLNLSAKRRLCNMVGGRIVEGCAACCCAVPAARARAATTTNLARSSLALVLRARFGGAKSCALVKFFMICPRLSASG